MPVNLPRSPCYSFDPHTLFLIQEHITRMHREKEMDHTSVSNKNKLLLSASAYANTHTFYAQKRRGESLHREQGSRCIIKMLFILN